MWEKEKVLRTFYLFREVFFDCVSFLRFFWFLKVYGFFCFGFRYKVKILIFNKRIKIDIFRDYYRF